MCGISGFIDGGHAMSGEELRIVATRMADRMKHRGPDDGGAWVDGKAGIALGFRRLSILDLSEQGRQPMISPCGRYVIVFNGEIYNFASLRDELSDAFRVQFRGHSDTEVMLALISRIGIYKAVERFNGMFAFAVWDRELRTLHLGRDRCGEKPLYYGWAKRSLLFASELKAIKYHPDFAGEIDRDVLTLYLRHNYVPAPYSIYKNYYKLVPGTLLSIPLDAGPARPSPVPYWSAKSVVEQGLRFPFEGNDAEAIDQLDTLLRDAVRLRLVADVPVGAFLSGGVDSSTVVALMQAQSTRPVRTFTIGFDEAEYNEADDAEKVARALGTDHTGLTVKPEQAREVIPLLPELYDEPFADSSQIPTFLVSRLARRHVTVSLSGDGGDELFAGYNRYMWGRRIWGRFGRIPRWTRSLAGWTLNGLTPRGWERFEAIIPAGRRPRNLGDKISKLGKMLTAPDAVGAYVELISQWENPSAVVLGAVEPSTVLTRRDDWMTGANITEQMMYLDAATYLPDDILTKVDRASMGVGLEARVPLLDHRVVEFAWRLPLSMKIRMGRGKWLLRQVLYRYVPRKLIERPKTGFGVPIDSWLRGPLRRWAEDLLDERRLRIEGYLNSALVRHRWAEHLSGRCDWQYPLWGVLMFQAWLDHERESRLLG